MQELSVVVEQKQGLVTANFEEVKSQLYLAISEYRGLTYTEETAVQAKADISTLRKLRKAIDDKRKEVKKAQMIPYEEFEKKAKELVAIIDEAINPIEEQISEFETNRKAERKEGILKYFNSTSELVADYADFNFVFNEKMLNVSTTQKSIKESIDTYVDSVKRDVETIQAMNSEATNKALEKYKDTKRLSDAIQVVTDFERQKAEIIARREAEEKECKAREEKEAAERLQREKQEAELAEQAKIKAEIEKAKMEERKKIEQEMAIQRAKDEEARRIKEKAERIERERIAEEERLARIEQERIADEQRKIDQAKQEAEAKRIADEKKKNQKYFIKVSELKKDEMNGLASYLKSNNYHFESGLE